jgi:hypothetical protein
MADEDNKGGDDNSTSEEQSQDNQQQQQTTDQQQGSQDFDYGKELERTQGGSKYTPLEKAIFSAKKIADEIKKHGGDPASIFQGPSQDDQQQDQQSGDKPPSRDDIQKMIDDGLTRGRSTLFEPILDSKITPITRSADEAKLVKHWTNTILPHVDGNVDMAVEIGWFISNRHRFKETFAEITRGKQAATMASDGQGTGQKKPTPKSEPTGKEAEFAKSKGLVWDENAHDGKGGFVSPAAKEFKAKQRKN